MMRKHWQRANDKRRFGGNRKIVLQRDNYQCQICGSKENLCIHHIDGKDARFSTDEPNHSLENLITLCNGCHMRLHLTGKKKNRIKPAPLSITQKKIMSLTNIQARFYTAKELANLISSKICNIHLLLRNKKITHYNLDKDFWMK